MSSLNVCENHDFVVVNTSSRNSSCPVCEMETTIKLLEKDIGELEDDKQYWENEYNDLKHSIVMRENINEKE